MCQSGVAAHLQLPLLEAVCEVLVLDKTEALPPKEVKREVVTVLLQNHQKTFQLKIKRA